MNQNEKELVETEVVTVPHPNSDIKVTYSDENTYTISGWIGKEGTSLYE